VNISAYSAPAQVILRAMKKYGLIVADNGSNWYISGAPDDRWDDEMLNTLKQIKGSDFEAVQTVDAQGNPIYPSAGLGQGRQRLSGPMARVGAATELYALSGARVRTGSTYVPAGAYLLLERGVRGEMVGMRRIAVVAAGRITSKSTVLKR
jgi:hypothetical protein